MKRLHARSRRFPQRKGGRGGLQARTRCAAQAPAAPQDAFIAQALSASRASNSAPEALFQRQMPTSKVESFRFTNLSPLLEQRLQAPPAQPDAAAAQRAAAQCPLEAAQRARVVIVDGQLCADASDLSGLPDGVFVGGAEAAPAALAQHAGRQARERGGVFAELNAASAVGRLAVHVPAGARCDAPLHIVHVSTGAHDDGSAVASAPQAVVVCEEGSSLEIVEEFVSTSSDSAGAGGGAHFCNGVTEVVLAKGAELLHKFAEADTRSSFHIRGTYVEQHEGSQYALTEARLGGRLTRHDVSIRQLGPRTRTALKHFVLCGADQLHDLHTSLVLDHPDGQAEQLHKCIVAAASGSGVFDGNVQVNQHAQRTDAGQLSRNLLLVPRATVNVKPNLQIIADDVTCTHGCAVSDLSAEEMFYFRSRGIDAAAARRALVVSFGAEVVQLLGHEELIARTQDTARAMLTDVV